MAFLGLHHCAHAQATEIQSIFRFSNIQIQRQVHIRTSLAFLFFVKNKQRRVQQFDWIFLKTRELISVFIDKRELFAVDFLRMKRHDLALSDAYSINPISYETSRRRFSRVDTTWIVNRSERLLLLEFKQERRKNPKNKHHTHKKQR